MKTLKVRALEAAFRKTTASGSRLRKAIDNCWFAPNVKPKDWPKADRDAMLEAIQQWDDLQTVLQFMNDQNSDQ